MKNLSQSPPGKILPVPDNPTALLLYAKGAQILSSPQPPTGSRLLLWEWEQHREVLAISHDCQVLGASPRSKQDQQERAVYQWRVDSKLSAAGRAHRGEGQHDTLPAFPGQSLFPGSAAPWVLFAFPSPAAPQDCSVITACQLVKDSRCLSRRFSLTWHDISPHKALLYHYKVILKENGLVFSIILYCVW